jgi:hypothetical protein
MKLIEKETAHGAKSPNPRTAKDRVRREARHNLQLATSMGLLALLLLAVSLVVERASEIPSDPASITQWVKWHVSTLYFMEAMTLVKPLVKTPVESWSRQLVDPGTGCAELGNGIWYAEGIVDTRSDDGRTIHQDWKICFVADTCTPLYSKVGNLESGDMNQALKLAQTKPAVSNPTQ